MREFSSSFYIPKIKNKNKIQPPLPDHHAPLYKAKLATLLSLRVSLSLSLSLSHSLCLSLSSLAKKKKNQSQLRFSRHQGRAPSCRCSLSPFSFIRVCLLCFPSYFTLFRLPFRLHRVSFPELLHATLSLSLSLSVRPSLPPSHSPLQSPNRNRTYVSKHLFPGRRVVSLRAPFEARASADLPAPRVRVGVAFAFDFFIFFYFFVFFVRGRSRSSDVVPRRR
jgi:hypothetical protein